MKLNCLQLQTFPPTVFPSGPHSSRMATQERQRLLQEQYYFLCQCEACTLQEQQPDEGEEGRQQCAGGRPQEAGLLCGKCRGSLKVGVLLGFICEIKTQI